MRVAAVMIALASACSSKPEAAEVTPDAPDAPDALGANDVSVLFPRATALWPPTLPAKGGVLLSEAAFRRLQLSLVRELDEPAEYAALRVVSVRFDPCFRTEIGGACQPQVRLVFQIPDPDPAKGFLDGALHALYAIAPASLPTLANELRRLARLAPENAAKASLGVSPALSAQGLASAYGEGLKRLVSSYAGDGSLVRMTFMTRTHARSGQWQFGGFHGSGAAGEGEKISIAGIHATQQNVTRSLGDALAYTVEPLFAEPEGRPGTHSATLEQLAKDARAAVHAWALRQEDPVKHLPDTTDCASCHLGGQVARHLEALDPALVTDALRRARGVRDITEAETNLDNLRAFGWVGATPHVSQRTANETVAVLRGLALVR